MDKLFDSSGSHGFNIIQVPYDPVYKKGDDGMFVATGIYINYLETENAVFLPRFEGDLKAKDAEALEIFTRLFKKIGKDVVSVLSAEIAEEGGVLNCITWKD